MNKYLILVSQAMVAYQLCPYIYSRQKIQQTRSRPRWLIILQLTASFVFYIQTMIRFHCRRLNEYLLKRTFNCVRSNQYHPPDPKCHVITCRCRLDLSAEACSFLTQDNVRTNMLDVPVLRKGFRLSQYLIKFNWFGFGRNIESNRMHDWPKYKSENQSELKT